ncbi:hypothetical protein FHX15_004377 [Rhizobium sp. BK650]|nr:hypothetical protein [Rhizobium sp. BK650]
MASDEQTTETKPDRRRHRHATDEYHRRYGYPYFDSGYQGQANDKGFGIKQRGDDQ